MDWFETISDPPHAVWAESGGPGDDIRLLFPCGRKAEIQVKKGLKVGEDLWAAMMALSRGVADGTVEYGLLAICPDSSGSISRDLAEDLIRIGQGRTDDLSRTGAAFLSRLGGIALPADEVCRRLRIQTLAAIPANEADVRIARAHLAALLENDGQVSTAWDRLTLVADQMIRQRGAQSIAGVLDVLEEAGVKFVADPGSSPVALMAAVRTWSIHANEHFSIIGIKRPLSVRSAWIPIKAVVHDDDKAPLALQEAVEHYHKWSSLHRPSGKHLDPLTIGRFYTRAVVVAGPGMGKSTLLRRLALEYADEGFPVVRLALRAVAARMADRGETFGQAAFEVGLADSGLHSATAQQSLSDWVLLCDGLDECGKMQDEVANGLRAYAIAHPNRRLIVTTRPIGYRRATLADWRHYGLFPGDDGRVTDRLSDLLENILAADDPKRDETLERASSLEGAKIKGVISRSPLLISLAASLLSRGVELGDSEPALYDRLINLIENEPSARKPEINLPPSVRARFLEHLGTHLLEAPLSTRRATLEACASRLATELGWTELRAKAGVDECSAHWEAVGIVERIWHEDSDALTFVHKTFGEFLAARDLLGLKHPALRSRIDEKVRQPEFNEVLQFAAALGAAPSIIDAHYIAAISEGSVHHLSKAVDLAIEFGVNHATRANLVDATFTSICSEDPREARRAGEALLNLTKSTPQSLGARVEVLLDHTQVWTRLAAWCFAVLAGPEHYDLSALQSTLRTLPTEGYFDSSPLRGGWDLADLGTWSLVETLAVEGARQVLTRCPIEEADELLAPVLTALYEHGGMGFRFEVRSLVKSFDREYAFKAERSGLERWSNPDHDAAAALKHRRFLLPLVELDSTAKEAVSLAKAFELAGFLDATRFSNSLISDAWDWRKDQNPRSLAATVTAIARMTGLDLARLSSQARRFLAEHDALPSDQTWRASVALPDVDHPEVDWARAADSGLDVAAIEPTLYHLSDFAVMLSSRLIHYAASVELALQIGKRALETGRYLTLVAGVYLAQRAGDAVVVDLIHDRLARPLDKGCDRLFDALTKFDHAFDDRAKATLRGGLFADDLKVAVEAAALALHYAERSDVDIASLLSLVSSAYDYWVDNEPAKKPDEPNVPKSPRETLLKAAWKMRSPDIAVAIELLGDPCSEIQSLARTEVLERAGIDQGIIRHLVRAKLSQKTDGDLVPALLAKGVSLDPESVEDLRALLRDPDAKQRFAVINLLDPRYLSTEEILVEAKRLSQDPYSDIRARAFSVIRRYAADRPNMG